MPWLVIIVGGLLILLAAVMLILYKTAFYTRPKHSASPLAPLTAEQEKLLHDPDIAASRAMIAEILALPYEAVSIRSRDGLLLRGRLYIFDENGASAPLAILFHGYRGTAASDFRGIFRAVRELGCNILLVSQRAHGESEGSAITFGIRERLDCVQWTEFAAERLGNGVPIALYGVSMGAATVLSASELELAPSVRCIVADCGFTSPREIIKHVMRSGRTAWLYPLVALSARLFGGFSLGKSGAIDAVRRNSLPILFLHGEKDRFVPCDMSRAMFEAAGGEKRILTFENAKHLQSFLLNRERYTAALREFFGDYLH